MKHRTLLAALCFVAASIGVTPSRAEPPRNEPAVPVAPYVGEGRAPSTEQPTETPMPREADGSSSTKQAAKGTSYTGGQYPAGSVPTLGLPWSGTRHGSRDDHAGSRCPVENDEVLSELLRRQPTIAGRPVPNVRSRVGKNAGLVYDDDAILYCYITLMDLLQALDPHASLTVTRVEYGFAFRLSGHLASATTSIPRRGGAATSSQQR